MARARNNARPRPLRDKPHAPDLSPPECRPTADAATDESVVLDDLPELIPVTGPELDVIETHLGNLIDRLLMDAASNKAVTPAPTSNPGMPVRASRPRS